MPENVDRNTEEARADNNVYYSAEISLYDQNESANHYRAMIPDHVNTSPLCEPDGIHTLCLNLGKAGSHTAGQVGIMCIAPKVDAPESQRA